MSFIAKLFRLQELIIAFVLTFVLEGIHCLVLYIYRQNWQITAIDIDKDAAVQIDSAITVTSFLILILGIITFPAAIYFSAINYRLSVPIRWLATVESAVRMLFSIFWLLRRYCTLSILPPSVQCTASLANTFTAIYNTATYDYGLYEIAQYAQLMISLGRFFAVHFDGFLYRYTLKWPLVQVALPFVVRIGLEKLKMWLWPEGVGETVIEDHIVLFPTYLACCLDVMTYRRMQNLKRNGSNVSRAETLLMIQMLSCSIVTLVGSVGYLAVAIPVQLFVGPNLFNKVYFSFASLLQCLFFSLAASLIAIFCMKRPESRGVVGSSTTPTTQLTRL